MRRFKSASSKVLKVLIGRLKEIPSAKVVVSAFLAD